MAHNLPVHLCWDAKSGAVPCISRLLDLCHLDPFGSFVCWGNAIRGPYERILLRRY